MMVHPFRKFMVHSVFFIGSFFFFYWFSFFFFGLGFDQDQRERFSFLIIKPLPRAFGARIFLFSSTGVFYFSRRLHKVQAAVLCGAGGCIACRRLYNNAIFGA